MLPVGRGVLAERHSVNARPRGWSGREYVALWFGESRTALRLLHLHTDLVALEGAGHLERVRWRNNVDAVVEVRDIRHVFLMTGAVPNTRWLEGCVALDSRGFVKTGMELSQADLVDARWPLTRAPRVLETSRPGAFAVGDVRSGSMKRVASAVGQGANAAALSAMRCCSNDGARTYLSTRTIPVWSARFLLERRCHQRRPSNGTTAATQFLQVKDQSYAHRRFGNGSGPPLLCLCIYRPRHWDPAVI